MSAALLIGAFAGFVAVVAYRRGRRDGQAALLREQGEEAEAIWRTVQAEMLMSPPEGGALHFQDGPMTRYVASSPAEAIDQLTWAARRAPKAP